MKEQIIKNIIDTQLKWCLDKKLNMLPMHIEPEMADPSQDKSEDWKTWFPISSKVTDEEIEGFEKQIGIGLPKDYKTFLKHKHFYDLYILEVSFCAHPVNIWRAKQVDKIFNGWPTEFLIDRGYLPFADWSDWGLLCFDTNDKKQDNNYPIVLWDHEIAEKVQHKFIDFYDLLVKLDEERKKNLTE